jgi:hypothetical protein
MWRAMAAWTSDGESKGDAVVVKAMKDSVAARKNPGQGARSRCGHAGAP